MPTIVDPQRVKDILAEVVVEKAVGISKKLANKKVRLQ